MERHALTEIGVCGGIALVCLVFFVQAWALPPGTFEPLGSGPVPQVTAAIVMICCLIVVVRAVLHLRAGEGIGAAARTEFVGRSPKGPIVTLVATILYIAALDAKLASFGLVSFVFLTALIWTLENFRTGALPWVLGVAATFAFGVEYLFTNVFVVDLPA